MFEHFRNWSPKKTIAIAVGCALLVRAAFLLFNYIYSFPPQWFSTVNDNYVFVAHHFGLPKIFNIEYLTSALPVVRYESRGPAIFHFIEGTIFGDISLWRLAFFGSLLDCLALVMLFQMTRNFLNYKAAQNFAFFYIFWPVSIFITAVPAWYVWFLWGMTTASFLGYKIYSSNSKAKTIKYSTLLVALIVLVGQFRPTINTYLIFLALFSVLMFLLFKNYKFLKFSAVISVAAMSALFIFGGINKLLLGEFIFNRKHIAHSFFMGVGDIQSPFAIENKLDADDDSVYAFYWRAHPERPYNQDSVYMALLDEDYNTWLNEQAKLFIKNHTGNYIQLVTYRWIRMLFPNFRISFYADVDALNSNEDRTLREERIKIIKSDQRYTLAGLKRLVEISGRYFLEILIRMGVMFFLPIGLFMGIFFVRKQQNISELILFWGGPLIYIIASLSLIRTPNFDHAAGWTVLFPLVIFGWVGLWNRLKQTT